MFAFSQIDPEAKGQVTDMEVPIGKYLRTSISQGIHDSIYSQWWRLNERWAEERDTEYPMLSAEEANKHYSTPSLRFEEPVRENIAMMLQSQHQEQAARTFHLTNDNHTIIAGAMGMSASMLASMLNPVDLALMFMPIVGQETKLAAGANALGRGRAALRTGLITRETLQQIIPKAPRLAESVIQGSAYMVAYEALNQPLARLEKRDVGDPLVNIATGAGMAAVFHGVVTAVARLILRMPPEVQQAMMQKAADDVAKGKPIDVSDIVKSTETTAALQVAAQDVAQAIDPTPPIDLKAFQEKIRGIFKSKLNALRKEVLPSKKKPSIPETAPEYEKSAFSSVFDEIRQRNLRTKEQIQRAFPEAQLTREEAAILRREAWGEQEIKKKHADNLLEVIEKVRNQVLPERQVSLKRQARIEAERNMPNPFKDEAEIKNRLPNKALPDEKSITVIEDDIKALEKKLPKSNEISPESIGLVPQKGRLGKTGWYTTEDTGVSLSVIIDKDSIHLNHIAVEDQGKGIGSAWINKLKKLADASGKKITLDSVATHPSLQERLNKFYEKHGFTKGDKHHTYTPKKEAPVVKEKSPKKKPSEAEQIRLTTEAELRQLSEGYEANELTPKDLAASIVDSFKGKKGYGELMSAAKKYLKELDEDVRLWGNRGNEDTAAEGAFMDLFEEHIAKLTPEKLHIAKPQEIADELSEGLSKPVRYDGVQTWIADQPKDVYTLMDKKNPFTVYVAEGAPKEVVESAFKAKIAENTPMPKAIETAVDCVIKNLL